MMVFQALSIKSPDSRLDPLRRETECRAALRDSFAAVALAAEEVGWSSEETALALLRLAGAHVNEGVTSAMARTAVRSRERAVVIERRGRWLANSPIQMPADTENRRTPGHAEHEDPQ